MTGPLALLRDACLDCGGVANHADGSVCAARTGRRRLTTRQEPDASGWIYLIQCSTGEVKVGWTAKAVSTRLSTLQVSHPHPLRVVGSARGTRKQESCLHELMKPYHVRGEWFTADVLNLWRQPSLYANLSRA